MAFVCDEISFKFARQGKINSWFKFVKVLLLFLQFLVSEVKADKQNRFIRTFSATFLFQFLSKVAKKCR